MRAYIARNDELAKKNDSLTKTINELKHADGLNKGETDTFPSSSTDANNQVSRLDSDHN